MSYPYMDEVNLAVVRAMSGLQKPSLVLDVGCGRAALGQALTEQGFTVWGVEADAGAAAVARTRIAQLINADLHDVGTVRRALGERRPDVVLFSDVLEHLYDPRTVLERYLELLAPDGRLVVSVPNAVVWSNRLAFLFGHFDYQDTGVLDRTHIRFFTRKTLQTLLEACGLEIESTDFDPHVARALLPLLKRRMSTQVDPRALLDSPGYRLYKSFVEPCERRLTRPFERLSAFRLVAVARPLVVRRLT